MADEARGFYAVQFHPEVTHTLKGREMFSRFVHDICGCDTDWTCPIMSMKPSPPSASKWATKKSSSGCRAAWIPVVAAALIHRAIGDQLTCVFVDNGLLRLNEAKQVMETFVGQLWAKVIHVDATEQFMGKLARRD
jgi:GMP synthase (glutamine-hydrolysing)